MLKSVLPFAFFAAAAFGAVPSASADFVHPGCLSTQQDLDRMAAKVAAGEQPWAGSWDILVENTDDFMDDAPRPSPTVYVDSRNFPSNYMNLARDAAKVYQLALRYHGSGEDRFADKAVEILNAWAAVHEDWEGDSNVNLRAGLYGYQLACGAELLRNYDGWTPDDFAAFRRYMLETFLPYNRDFLIRRNGTVPDHYWANWTLANQASVMAIGVLCDRRDLFDEAVRYFHDGPGTENVRKAVNFLHPDGLGQWQESGRDQGHTLMGPQLMGVVCEIAWNQGVDLYGAENDRFLAGVEYISKYNLGYDVPYVVYVREMGHPGRAKLDVNEEISAHGRGLERPGWDLIYNHYVNRRGLAAPWTAKYAEKVRPEGGGFSYGGNSGGFDGLGFTTLTHSRDPIPTGARPGAPRLHVDGREIVLSWSGTAGATEYRVKRSSRPGGPYRTIATTNADELSHVDEGLEPGETYFYVVTADTPKGETAPGDEASAAANGQLSGEILGTEGSFRDSGAAKECVFDGWLENFFDGPRPDSWVGLDLGPAGVVLTEVRYCPREGHAGRMVGGKFQGSSTADFGDVVNLLTIAEAPPEGELTSRRIDSPRSFRFVRYVGPEDGYGNVAELQFHGTRRSQGDRRPR